MSNIERSIDLLNTPRDGALIGLTENLLRRMCRHHASEALGRESYTPELYVRTVDGLIGMALITPTNYRISKVPKAAFPLKTIDWHNSHVRLWKPEGEVSDGGPSDLSEETQNFLKRILFDSSAERRIQSGGVVMAPSLGSVSMKLMPEGSSVAGEHVLLDGETAHSPLEVVSFSNDRFSRVDETTVLQSPWPIYTNTVSLREVA